jgi:hypothetical protein
LYTNSVLRLSARHATAGGVVFTNGPIGGGISTYMVGGKQYVAVAAGMRNEIMKTDSGLGAVILYSLGSDARSAMAE